MTLSVTQRILGPIVILILVGSATTGWISFEAVQTHSRLQAEEEHAREIVAAVERAQASQYELAKFIAGVLEFNTVIARGDLENRFSTLVAELISEMSHIKEIGAESRVIGSVNAFDYALMAWTSEAQIALGLVGASSIPTAVRLEHLASRSKASLNNIHLMANEASRARSESNLEEYSSRLFYQYSFLAAGSAACGLFFFAYGRRFAGTLNALAGAMERIRGGENVGEITSSERRDEVGQIARGVAAFGETLHDLREANEKVTHLALHDQLTGLANRRSLEDHLNTLLATVPRPGGRTAVFHLDLDRFKQVNDVFGHAAGDEILRHASAAMTEVCRRSDFASRIGGDEFVMVLHDVQDEESAAKMAERVIAAVSEPIQIGDELAGVGTSIGIVMHDDASEAGISPDRLLENADMALYAAKAAGRGTYAFFSNETRQRFEADVSLLKELRRGLDQGEIIGFFQPQVDGVNLEIKGAECLARWNHPTRGILGPGEFLDVAFSNGLGDKLAEVMLQQAIDALVEWRAAGVPIPAVSVNFSARQLRDGKFVEDLDFALVRAGLKPSEINIEVLESVLFGEEADPAHAAIAKLQESGHRIELDDFGTGHASISNLRKFKVNGVKIDRYFVSGVDTDPEQEMILRTMIDLCHNLGISCLAEGVENDAEMSKLVSLGCSAFQGFGIARPMPREAVADWTKTYLSNRAIKTAV